MWTKHFLDCKHKDADGMTTLNLDESDEMRNYSHCIQCGMAFALHKVEVNSAIPSEFHKTMDRLKSGSGIDLSAETMKLTARVKDLEQEVIAKDRMITKLQAALGKSSKTSNVHCVVLELAPDMIVPLNIKEVNVDKHGAHIIVTGGFGVQRL